MAVLTSKDEKELIVTCSCGCEDSVHLSIEKWSEDDYAFMMFMNGAFTSAQDKTFRKVFKEKVQKIWAIIRNKDYYYHDIRMSKEDFETFKEYINKVSEKKGE